MQPFDGLEAKKTILCLEREVNKLNKENNEQKDHIEKLKIEISKREQEVKRLKEENYNLLNGQEFSENHKPDCNDEIVKPLNACDDNDLIEKLENGKIKITTESEP